MQANSKLWIWIALLAVASVAFSFALACAAPLAAFATVAALHTRRGEAFAFLIVVWLVNQVVGYGFHAYPRDLITFAWGLALLASAGVAMACAKAAMGRLKAGVAGVAIGFAAAFVGYEGTLYLAHFALGGGVEAYAPAVVAQILVLNALALVSLMAIQPIAARFGVAPAFPASPAFARG